MKNNNYASIEKQRGSTLFLSLVFLTLMTLITVSSAKIASLDAAVASNNQQQVLAYQQTATTLESINNPVTVIQAMVDNSGVFNEWSLDLSTKDTTVQTSKRMVKNRNVIYQCQNGGTATSIGSSCALIDLSSQDELTGTGIKDQHFRGVGKAVPTNPGYTN